MDLNQLLHRHQVSLMCAQAAIGPEAHHAHRGLARLYANRIDALRSHTQFPMQLAGNGRTFEPA